MAHPAFEIPAELKTKVAIHCLQAQFYSAPDGHGSSTATAFVK